MRRDLRVVVTGYIGLLPAGGVTWDYIQFPLGFRELGCDVLYLEDTQQWPVYQHCDGAVNCEHNVAYLDSVMHRFGLNRQWAYRDEVTGRWHGRTQEEVRHFCATADIFVNVSCSTPMREEYFRIPIRALIDTDPMFTQVQCATGRNLYGGTSSLPSMVTAHTHLFTFGENVGQPGCDVPASGHHWRTTRQPVVLKHWPATPQPDSGAYTSIFNWTACKEFEFMGRNWGQKNTEFMRFMELPRQAAGVSFCIGVGQTTGAPFPADAARANGWQVLNPGSVAADVVSYQDFIRNSRAEFSVAKQTYVQAKTGWFSCRSACYLAAGRPVVTQDTGWSSAIPNGCGLFAFSGIDDALAAIREIERAPLENGRAARAIAEEEFDSHKVLRKLLRESGV